MGCLEPIDHTASAGGHPGSQKADYDEYDNWWLVFEGRADRISAGPHDPRSKLVFGAHLATKHLAGRNRRVKSLPTTSRICCMVATRYLCMVVSGMSLLSIICGVVAPMLHNLQFLQIC